MTLPMSVAQKIREKLDILEDLNKINLNTQVSRNCLLLADEDDFNSDYIVIAKNMAFDNCELIQGVEHRLHEIMDAPLFPEIKNGIVKG